MRSPAFKMVCRFALGLLLIYVGGRYRKQAYAMINKATGAEEVFSVNIRKPGPKSPPEEAEKPAPKIGSDPPMQPDPKRNGINPEPKPKIDGKNESKTKRKLMPKKPEREPQPWDADFFGPDAREIVKTPEFQKLGEKAIGICHTGMGIQVGGLLMILWGLYAVFHSLMDSIVLAFLPTRLQQVINGQSEITPRCGLGDCNSNSQPVQPAPGGSEGSHAGTVPGSDGEPRSVRPAP